ASRRTMNRSSSPPRRPPGPRAPRPPPRPAWCGWGPRAPVDRDAARAIRSRLARRDALGERREPGGVHLGLRLERVRGERVGREQLEGQLAPADAKCGLPPPFPPDTAAIALAMSPAFTPCCTRSSVTATCTPARSPFVNRMEIARLWLERNASITSPI